MKYKPCIIILIALCDIIIIMSSAIEHFLKSNGPCLSTEVSEHLTKNLGLTPAAARKRVSRAGGEVKRLGYISFPHKARFTYLQQQFASPHYWDSLTKALLKTNSAYGLAIAALRLRNNLIPVEHFSIACGSPLQQSKHLSPNTVFERLEQAGLLQKTKVPSLGECISLIQHDGYYDNMAPDVQARLFAEKLLLLAIRDWLRKLGLVSYDKVAIREDINQPKVGTFTWDLTAPCYLGSMVRLGRDGTVKPGFVVSDVYFGNNLVDSSDIQPFIHKCVTLRALRNVGACMQIFVAKRYAQDAFQLLKNNGIVPATPNNLFGDEVADGLTELSSALTKAAEVAIDPDSLQSLFKKLGKIEGASNQLRGAFFEYLVADIARKTISSQIIMKKVLKLADDTEVEADVIAVQENKSITFIECKGYNPNAKVKDHDVKRWLQRTVPLLFRCAKSHPDWKNLKIYCQFWTTGYLSTDALAMFTNAQKTINKARYEIKLCRCTDILSMCKSTNNHGLVTTFKNCFMKNYYN